MLLFYGEYGFYDDRYLESNQFRTLPVGVFGTNFQLIYLLVGTTYI